MLSVVERERTLVAACCALALSAGVHRGMPLAEARALLRHPPYVEEHSSIEDRRDLLRLARWAYRFVPIVALDGDDGLLFDASGCGHLYGGIDRLAHRMLRGLRRAGIVARIAAAPTLGSAWALARFGHGASARAPSRAAAPLVVVPDQLDQALRDLPIESLRTSAGSVDALHAVGVEQIGQLRALPRASIATRYASEVLLRLDQALGSAMETITPIRPKWPLLVEHLFEGPTDRLEVITLATRQLLEQMALALRRQHRGSLSLQVELLRSDMEALFIPVRTSEASADALHLWTLLAPKVERAHLGFGVQGVRLVVLRSKRLRDAQGTCWPSANHQPSEVVRLLDTLHARLGSDRVVRPTTFESHLPERAFAFASILDSPRASRPSPAHPGDRPTLLLSTPTRIDVSLLVPDGPIVSLRWRNEPLSVRTCLGPELLAGEWWRGTDFSTGSIAGPREYFKVQIEDGRWLWVFRIARERADQWHLHGEWA